MKVPPLLCRLGVTLALAGCLFAADARRPNIIFILADDLGYMDVGAYNPATFYETPNIDALARRGMRFTQGYAACCVCSPSRGSIMTGKYPPRFGITEFIGGRTRGRMNPAPCQDHLALEEVTIAERLREAGYATFFSGKWHLGSGGFSPNAQGFGPGLQPVEGTFFYPPSDGPVRDVKADPKTTEQIADGAVRFIESHRDAPFFAYLPFQAVHVPIRAPAALVSKYELKKKSAPPDAWVMERGKKMRAVQNDAVFAAMLEQLDSAIGRVLAAVVRAGLAEKTVIVFTSDNGGECTAGGAPTANLPLRAGKGWPYEGGVREPWIVCAPGVTKPGSTCDMPVIGTDFYPTLLELAGLALQPAQHRDGVSIMPLLKGGTMQRGPIFWHYPHYGNQGGAPYGAVRDGDWKLIEWYEDGALELYNLAQDLGEKNNLAAQQSDKVKALHDQLAAWRQEVNAIMPKPNPDYKPNAKPPAQPANTETKP